MGDQGLNFVCYYLSSFTFLDTLKLNNCKLTDDGASIIAHALSKTKIDKLYIKNNLITSKGFSILLSAIKIKQNLSLIAAKNNNLDENEGNELIKEFGNYNSVLFL